MTYLCKKISQTSGDIRVVFDVMRTAFQKVLVLIKNLDIECFDLEGSKITELKQKCKITLQMLLDIFDQKKGRKVSDMVDSLPDQNLYVLDALANLYDSHGEEKIIKFSMVSDEVNSYCK